MKQHELELQCTCNDWNEHERTIKNLYKNLFTRSITSQCSKECNILHICTDIEQCLLLKLCYTQNMETWSQHRHREHNLAHWWYWVELQMRLSGKQRQSAYNDTMISSKHFLRGICNVQESIWVFVCSVNFSKGHWRTDHGATVHDKVKGLGIC